MQNLEKILEEIEKLHGEAGSECTSEDHYVKRAWEQCIKRVEDIICKHMNDGWISVEERLPENNKLVLVWARSTARGADEWSLGSYDKGFWALGSYGGSLVFPSQLEAVAWRSLPEPYRPERSRE